MIAVIDNYDSFTYNLVQYLGELGAEIEVYRNDAITVDELEQRRPNAVLISPGPGEPDDAGISSEVIRTLGQNTPLLGVCLGHQCIGEVFGGRVERAPQLVHGKMSQVHHNGDALFEGVPSPFEAGRYHSLIVAADGLPPELDVIASTDDGDVMALRHRVYPIFGVQFHPESVLTGYGKRILRNFLNFARRKDARVEVKHPLEGLLMV